MDQLLADTKDFAGALPVDPTATGRAMADIEASQLRQRENPLERAWQSKVGVVGALADSAATPIRVASGFTGMGAGIGEGIAQGLEAIAHLDGKPLAPGGTTLGDATRSIGKVATSTAFGKLASLNPLTGMLKDAPASAATSLAAKLMGKATTGAVGAIAGAVEGAVPNVAQGAFTRAFDAGDISAAFDPAGIKMDAGLGVGMGAPMGAIMALGQRAARAGSAGLSARAPKPSGPSSAFPKQPPTAPWQADTDAAFENQGSAWFNETPEAMTPAGVSVRGPAVRQRQDPNAPPPGVAGLLGPASSVQLGADPMRFDPIDPNNGYMGPADPTGQPPGVPPVRPIAPAGPSLEQMLADLEANPPAPIQEPSPPPTAPQLPRGRFAADSPTAQAAEPFVPPVAEPLPPDTRNRDAFFAAMLEEPPAAPVVDAPQGPMVMQPFEQPIPPAIAKSMSNPMFGTPERVRFDGQQVEVFYQGRPQPIRMSPEQFADFSPELNASAPRAAQALEPPSHLDDPVMADLLNQVRAERAGPPPPPAPPVMESPAPGILAEPGTPFAPDPTPPLTVAADETAEFSDDQLAALLAQADAQDAAVAPPVAPQEPSVEELEALLRQADEQDALEANSGSNLLQEPTVEVLDPEAAPTQNNGSGESAASTENTNRMRSMKAQGREFMVFDRAGNGTPLIGDAVDQFPAKGKTTAIRNADGSFEVVQDNGGRLPPPKVDSPVAKVDSPAEPSELDRIVLDDPAPAPVTELFDNELPAVAKALPEAEGIVLGEGDTPGTINQAGKFAALGDDWRSQEPGKNKNLVVRKADGTYQVVKNNGGKTPKTWSKELADIRESQTAARRAKEEERLAGIAARKAEKDAAATQRAEARKAAGEAPEPVVADEPEPAAATPAEPAAGPTTPPKVERTKFGDNDAVDVRFERAPHESVRAGLTEYGFRYLPWKQKWSFKIPAGSKLTQDDVDAAAQAILRGESPESAQRAINADSLTQKAAATAATEGRWAPEPTATKLFDRDLSPDATERDVRRQALRGMGWTNGKEGNRRIWTKPGDGAMGDLELRTPTSAPEVPPANPPQAEAPSVPSAVASDATTTPSSTTPSGTGDEIRIAADKVKVDADAYQFKTGIDKRGRTEKLKGVGSWRERTNKLNRVLLHERLDGSFYVVDGHQRVGLAQDLKAQGKDVPDLHAVVLRERDGVTVDDARREGAMENLVGGTTEPLDIARVMRSGDLTPEEQAQVGKIQSESGERFRQGRDLAQLEDAAFTYLLNTGDSIKPHFARLVSQYQGEKLQLALLRALENDPPANVSAAKSILAKASDAQLTESQPDIFGNVTVDTNAKELVKFEQSVLGIFKKNRRLFGKSADNASFLEQAGATKIDREAMADISTEAGKAEFLFDKYVNASGSHTKQAIKEAFDEVNAGRLSLGAASDRVAKALEADFTGRPPGGPPSAGDLAEVPDDAGPGLFGDDGLFGDAPTGGISDQKAVTSGRSDGALDDGADDVLDRAKGILSRLLEDESGSMSLEGLGAGMEGLENLYKKNPRAVMSAVRTAGGAFFGAATAEDDEASWLDNAVLGAAAGYGAGKVPGIAKALYQKAPTFAKALKDTMETGRLLSRGEYVAVPQVRRSISQDKDISGLAMKFWSPDKVVPDLWKHIEPIMEDIRNIDNGAATVFEARIARRAKLDEALAALEADSRKSANKGHYRRMKYIDALHDELTNKPTWIEKQVSEATSGKVTPRAIRQANAVVTNAIYHNLLGWAVDSGLANMTQALMNIPQIGVKSTVKGIVKAYSTAGRQELKFLNVARPMGQDEEKLFHPWLETYLDWSQKPMSWTDSGNRRATWAGAMDYAAKRGMGKAEAEDFAKTLVGQTQGVAGELGSNPFHRHLGPLKVFTKYPTLWGSMLGDIATHPDAKVKMRALGMMTGIYAASAVSGVEWMNFFWPRMGGLPGPSIALDVIDHAMGAPDHDFEEHTELGGTEDRVLPRYWNKAGAILNRSGDERPIVGRKGQQLREISADEDLLSLFGIETTNRSAARKEESEMYQFAQDTRREEGINSRQARRRAGLAIAAGDNQAAGEAMSALSRRQQRDFLKDRKRTPLERARRQVPLSRRDEFDERFQQEDR